MATQCWRIMRACCQLGGNLYCHNEGCLATRAWYQLVISSDQSGDSGLTPGAWSISIIKLIRWSILAWLFISLSIDWLRVGWNAQFSEWQQIQFGLCLLSGAGGWSPCVMWGCEGWGTSLAFICYLYHNPDIDTGLSWTNNDLSFSEARCRGRSC